jgi:hypothetical protein
LYVTAYGVLHCKRELGVSGWSCCSSCCVVAGLGYVVGCIGFRCHIICVMLPGVGGNAEVEWGHAVCGYRNSCVCLVWV